MNTLIITAAVSGAEVTKKDNPNLPVTPEELAHAAKEAEEAGASIIHLHVRNADGSPTQDLEVFRNAMDCMKKAGVTAIIQPSTGGAVGMTAAERLQPLELKPEMASLDCGSINFGRQDVFINTPEIMEHFAAEMKKRGVLPEFECFDMGHLANALAICRGDSAPRHCHFNFVLGVPGGMPAGARNLQLMVDSLPPAATWTVTAIGRHQLEMAFHAVPMGGHIRVGFEDNIYYSRGVLAESNAQLVARVVRLAKEYGREVAGPDEARSILEIEERSGT